MHASLALYRTVNSNSANSFQSHLGGKLSPMLLISIDQLHIFMRFSSVKCVDLRECDICQVIFLHLHMYITPVFQTL